MIQARAGGFAGDGQAAGMHQHTGFYAQRLGGFLKRSFERPGVERGRGGKGVAELFQTRLVFRHEILLRSLRSDFTPSALAVSLSAASSVPALNAGAAAKASRSFSKRGLFSGTKSFFAASASYSILSVK